MSETITLTVTGMSHEGDALGRLPDGRAVFVPFALPGETVLVRLVSQAPRYARAALVEVLAPDPARIAPRCPYFTHCGGCHLQHMPYENQLQAKIEALEGHLKRTGGLEHIPLRPILPSPSPWNYRNHIELELTPTGKPGYHAPGSNKVIPVQECPIAETSLSDLLPMLDLEPVPGLQRIHLRLGAEEETLVAFEGAEPAAPEFEVDLPLSAVYLSPAGVQVLAGEADIVCVVNQRVFRVSAGAFFQVNIPVAEKIIDHILENLPPQLDTVLDLYSGGGLFSAFLAGRARRLVAIEANPAACQDFVVNLDEFDQVELYEAPVGAALPALRFERPPDLAIADPPRSGMGKNDLQALLAHQPACIVYVSCNPATLARDAQWLQQGGYTLAHITPFDMFPQTYHLETVSFWIKPG